MGAKPARVISLQRLQERLPFEALPVREKVVQMGFEKRLTLLGSLWTGLEPGIVCEQESFKLAVH